MTRSLTIGADQKRAHGIVAERGVEHEIELGAFHRIRQGGETKEIVQRLCDFRSAPMTVAHLALKPARIGGASTERARDLLAQGADPGGAGNGRVEMIERRIGPRFRRRGGEAALMLGESVGVERILSGQVQHMNEGLGAGESVTNVALDVGYESPSAFTAMFRRELGAAPRRYLRWSESEVVTVVLAAVTVRLRL